ncbi:MAG: DUF3343 domain-containing protein [Akkermansiaceae bacterium]|jgi:hypothetical protein
MSDSSQSVVLVYSTSHAIRIEKLLKAEKIPSKLIPVPRHLSSDCGVCVRFESSDREDVDRILERTAIKVQGIECL